MNKTVAERDDPLLVGYAIGEGVPNVANSVVVSGPLTENFRLWVDLDPMIAHSRSCLFAVDIKND